MNKVQALHDVDICPACGARVCDVCRWHIRPVTDSPTGWVHDAGNVKSDDPYPHQARPAEDSATSDPAGDDEQGRDDA